MRTWLVAVSAPFAFAACHHAAPPPADPPERVEIAAEPTASLVTAGAASTLAIRVRVSAAAMPTEARPPLDLVLALDTSGSMAGHAIAAVRDAATALVDRLGPDDRLGIVAFGTHAQVILPSVRMNPVTRAWADLEIAQLQARGTTDLADGLSAALDLADQGRVPGSIDRVVVMSDGVPNDATPVPSLVARARQSRTAITTLGVGVEFDENLLGGIALDTGGQYHFVDDATAVCNILYDEIIQMKQAVARGVVVTIAPGPGIALEEVPGVDDNGAARVAYLGDLAAGEVRDVIVPLSAGAHRDGAAVEIADVSIGYDDAANGTGWRVRDAYVSATASGDAAKVAASVKLPIETARRRAAAASAILDAIKRARGGDVAGGIAVLKQAEKDTRDAATTLHDSELAGFADRMAALEHSLAEIAVASDDTKVTTQEQQGQGAGGAADGAEPMNAAPAAAFARTHVDHAPAPTPPQVYRVANDRDVEDELRVAHEAAAKQLRE